VVREKEARSGGAQQDLMLNPGLIQLPGIAAPLPLLTNAAFLRILFSAERGEPALGK
jgi:hypothetical protein